MEKVFKENQELKRLIRNLKLREVAPELKQQRDDLFEGLEELV
jgi:hypothetical protein